MSSNDLAVSARGLSKSYLIAHNSNGPTTLREAIVERVKHPFGVNGQERETFWALNDVDFDIRQGETVGIIGRNGAGKSTLLKILSRITHPTRGVVDIYGRVASLLEVGTGFHGELTGRENVALNGSILGMSRREIKNKFDEIVAFAEVENFLDTPVKRYSSGMYVRLAFAVAAHLDPQILIVDEVLAVGDFAFQKKCLGKMQEVSGAGRTVLFVSHNLTSVSSLCQRAAWMKAGRLHRDGPASEVVEAYLSSSTTKTDGYHDLRSIARTYALN
ncbi:MAG: ABC transporter ATP-binding protein, partial [Isosphaeraceae bacterium]